MKSVYQLTILVIMAFCLSACGEYGPLYLPKSQQISSSQKVTHETSVQQNARTGQ